MGLLKSFFGYQASKSLFNRFFGGGARRGYGFGYRRQAQPNFFRGPIGMGSLGTLAWLAYRQYKGRQRAHV